MIENFNCASDAGKAIDKGFSNLSDIIGKPISDAGKIVSSLFYNIFNEIGSIFLTYKIYFYIIFFFLLLVQISPLLLFNTYISMLFSIAIPYNITFIVGLVFL